MAQDIIIATKASFSQDDKELVRNLYSKINELVYIINTKGTALYTESELFTSKQWYVGQDPNQPKQIYRKSYEIGALPNTGTINIPHGLALDTNWDFITISVGTAKSTLLTQWIPITNPDISIMIDAVNINVTTTTNLATYINTRIILEYTKP